MTRSRPGMRDLMRHRDYRYLVLGTGIDALGGAITPVALAFAVIDLGGTATDLGMVVGAFALAQVSMTLIGGVLGDRLPRQLMMQGSSLGAAVTQAVIAASLIGGWSSIGLLAGVGLLNGALDALSGPSSSAVTPQTVPEAELPAAVAFRRVLEHTARIVGYAVAGVLVGLIGPGWAIAIDAATFALAALCFQQITVPPLVRTEQAEPIWAEFQAGAAEVARHTWLWLLIAQALLYHLFYGGAQGVLGPIVVGEALHEAAWGWALSALVLGLMVGGLINARRHLRHDLLIGTFCLSLTATFPLAMALSDQLAVLLLGAFVHGVGLGVFDQSWQVAIVQNIPPEKLARVYSFDVVGSFVARPVGLALTGPIATAVGFDSWLIVVAAVMGGSSLLALASRDVRRLERRPV